MWLVGHPSFEESEQKSDTHRVDPHSRSVLRTVWFPTDYVQDSVRETSPDRQPGPADYSPLCWTFGQRHRRPGGLSEIGDQL